MSKNLSLHCREEGCIGKYIPRGLRDCFRANLDAISQCMFHQVLAENPLICDCKLFTKIRGLLFSAQLTLRGIPALYLFILFRFCPLKHKIIKYNGSRRSSGEHRVRDKLQLLGAFAEEEPITSQCSAVHCRTVQCCPLPCSAVQCSTVPLQRRSRWRQK